MLDKMLVQAQPSLDIVIRRRWKTSRDFMAEQRYADGWLPHRRQHEGSWRYWGVHENRQTEQLLYRKERSFYCQPKPEFMSALSLISYISSIIQI